MSKIPEFKITVRWDFVAKKFKVSISAFNNLFEKIKNKLFFNPKP